MPTIHPAFDTSTGTWFCEDFNVEAPTLRQLIAVLAKRKVRVTVKDYYPAGLGASIAGIRVENEIRKTRATEATKTADLPGRGNPNISRKSKGNNQNSRGWKDELAGARGAEHRTDRITPTAPKPYAPPITGDIESMALDMWAAGRTGAEIGAALGKTSTWVGTCVLPRARRCGDLRAVVRQPNNYGKSRNKGPRLT